jgi:hypothetical protein
MRATAVVVSVCLLLVGACADGDGDGSVPADTRDEQLVIKTSMSVAPTPGAEPIAEGAVLEGSTLDDDPFCAGGTIRDSHGSTDPDVWLIARTISCSDGTLRIDFTPEPAEGLTQKGTWEIVSGTDAFQGLAGSGDLETTYDPDDEAVALETYTGTVSR